MFELNLTDIIPSPKLKAMTEEIKAKTTIDDLAVMVKGGFDAMDGRFDKMENRLDGLEQGQEDIKLRLDNVAYRFELVELQRRVELVEKKVGINYQK